jgi:transposase InsO family protein
MAIQSIAIAMKQGARQELACNIVGITPRSLQNWRTIGFEDQRQMVKKEPANKLSKQEREQVLAVCNSEEFKDQSPKQIVPTLADKGLYIASESSFYRILRDVGQLEHRGRSSAPGTIAKPDPYVADGSNQVWSWDITYLASTVTGRFFYLYLFMDLFSRKIVGWEVYENESSELAAKILRKAKLSEALSGPHELVLHSDNGGPMKGATMLATMQKIGVVPSFSRPSVSNDNPFSEALFKTLKYVPIYPGKPFDSVEEARQWVAKFCKWYNNSHRHSGLKFVTPIQRHTGEDVRILEQRELVYAQAKKMHPERWSGKTRNWNHEAIVKLNPVNEQASSNELKKAA